jgi:hypothetical protein
LAGAIALLLAAGQAGAQSLCGNGVIDADAGEQCDTQIPDSECCLPDCSLAPGTTVCRAAGGPCDVAESCTGSAAACPADTGLPDADGDGACDLIDNCTTIPNPTQANGDADALGDACDPCTNLIPTGQEKVKLTLARPQPPAGDDRLGFFGYFTSVPALPAIDPLDNGIRFLITDATGSVPVDVTIPGGAYDPGIKAGWKLNGSATAWTYRNVGPTASQVDGIQKFQLLKLPFPPGKYKFQLKGKNGTFPVDTANLPLIGTLVLNPPFAAAGQCGEALFPVVPPGTPSCVAFNGGKVVKCR